MIPAPERAWGKALEWIAWVAAAIRVRWSLASARSGGHIGESDEELRERAVRVIRGRP